jgi:hypothetical protein
MPESYSLGYKLASNAFPGMRLSVSCSGELVLGWLKEFEYRVEIFKGTASTFLENCQKIRRFLQCLGKI